MGARLATPALALVALAMALILAWGWTAPLSLFEHKQNPWAGAQMVVFYGASREGAVRWAVPAALVIILYLIAIWLSGYARGRLATGIALGAPVLFSAVLLPAFPGGTQDIFHNVSDARLFWRYGENPTQVAPNAHPEDPFLPVLYGYDGLTSAYGPLWYVLAGLPLPFTGDDMRANAVGQKALSSTFFLGTVVVLWLAARGTPQSTAGAAERCGRRAAVLSGWCPLLLWEFAVNGHNDALMIFFVATALLAVTKGWWLWVFPLLALSALVKFTSVLLGPVLLLWLLRRPELPRRTLAASLGLAAAICVLAYLPFWAGRDTFAVLNRPGMTFINSPAALLEQALVYRRGVSAERADPVVYRFTGALFVFSVAGVLWSVQRRRTLLAAAGFDVVFAYLVFASWWFWQWYVVWLVPLIALPSPGRRTLTFLVMSSSALMSYLVWWSGAPDYSAGWFRHYGLLVTFVFAIPLLIWVTALIDVLPGRGATASPAPAPDSGPLHT